MTLEEYVAKTRGAAMAIGLPISWDMMHCKFRVLVRHPDFGEFFEPYLSAGDTLGLMCCLRIHPHCRAVYDPNTETFECLVYEADGYRLEQNLKSYNVDDFRDAIVELAYRVALLKFPGVEDVKPEFDEGARLHDRAGEDSDNRGHEVGLEARGDLGSEGPTGLSSGADRVDSQGCNADSASGCAGGDNPEGH